MSLSFYYYAIPVPGQAAFVPSAPTLARMVRDLDAAGWVHPGETPLELKTWDGEIQRSRLPRSELPAALERWSGRGLLCADLVPVAAIGEEAGSAAPPPADHLTAAWCWSVTLRVVDELTLVPGEPWGTEYPCPACGADMSPTLRRPWPMPQRVYWTPPLPSVDRLACPSCGHPVEPATLAAVLAPDWMDRPPRRDVAPCYHTCLCLITDERPDAPGPTPIDPGLLEALARATGIGFRILERRR